MELLERAGVLEELSELVGKAASGRGSIALVRGEAGIGKTSVLRELVRRASPDAFVLQGLCDDLITPRPFSPFVDMANDEPSIAAAIDTEDRGSLHDELLFLLSRSRRPTVLAIEDVHWADQSTLDVIATVGRRVDRTHALIVLTFRDDLPGDHPLYPVLGQLPADLIHDLPLQSLTLNAVQTMVDDETAAARIWELTAGNPFLVSELIRIAGEDVPTSVIHSVISRTERLSKSARRLIDVVSVVPGRTEIELIHAMDPTLGSGLREAEDAGILVSTGTTVEFRHELARRGAEHALSAERRRRMNSDVLAAAESLGYDVARLAHHAREADDPDSMVRVLPVAASNAARHGSHREAVAHFRALEPHLGRIPADKRARILEQWAFHEEFVSGSGLSQAQRALEVRRALGDQERLGASLLVASRCAERSSAGDLPFLYAEEAVRALQGSDGDSLAAAYAELSRLQMIRHDFEDAVAAAQQALELADGDSRARASALNTKGAISALQDYPSGVAEIEEAATISEKNGYPMELGRARANRVAVALIARDLDVAERLNERFLEDLDSESPAIRARQRGMGADIDLHRGNLARASAVLTEIANSQDLPEPDREWVMSDLAVALIRRGDPGGIDQLRQTERLLGRNFSPDLSRQVATAYAEHLYLAGRDDPETTARNLTILKDMLSQPMAWEVADLAIWLWLDGHIENMPEEAALPIRQIASGDWKAAASELDRLGMPYYRAIALTQGEADHQLEALRILHGMGAKPMAARVRKDLKNRGVKGVPHGVRDSTRSNEHGLTARQTEVLTLLERGMSNLEIAERLYISVRTVEKHVAAVLQRLGVSSRKEVVSIHRVEQN